MEKPFWINFELGHYKSVSYFCLIAGVVLLDCRYRVAGSLLLLLPISDKILDWAGTLSDCRMSRFIHHVSKKSLLLMLILGEHDQKGF